MNDVLQVQGINSKGFGTIPKLVMQDRRLTVQAKAIYGYFASYAGGGQTAFPGLDKILSDLALAVNTYYKHFNLLKKCGYIKAEQEKTPKGRFKRNVYTLMADVPFLKNSETEPFRNLPYTDICEANTNSSLEYKQGYGSNVSQSRQPANGGEQIGLDMTGLLTEQDIQWQLAKIKEQIDYDTLLEENPADTRLVDELVSIILDVMVSPSPYVRIDREERPRALVRHQLGLLDSEAVELVIGRYKAVTEPIKRKREYLLTALYNARMEFDAHYTNLVSNTMGGGGNG